MMVVGVVVEVVIVVIKRISIKIIDRNKESKLIFFEYIRVVI